MANVSVVYHMTHPINGAKIKSSFNYAGEWLDRGFRVTKFEIILQDIYATQRKVATNGK